MAGPLKTPEERLLLGGCPAPGKELRLGPTVITFRPDHNAWYCLEHRTGQSIEEFLASFDNSHDSDAWELAWALCASHREDHLPELTFTRFLRMLPWKREEWERIKAHLFDLVGRILPGDGAERPARGNAEEPLPEQTGSGSSSSPSTSSESTSEPSGE